MNQEYGRWDCILPDGMSRFAIIRLAHQIPGTRHLLSFRNGSEGNCCRRCGDFHDPDEGKDLALTTCSRDPMTEKATGLRRWWPQGKALKA